VLSFGHTGAVFIFSKWSYKSDVAIVHSFNGNLTLKKNMTGKYCHKLILCSEILNIKLLGVTIELKRILDSRLETVIVIISM